MHTFSRYLLPLLSAVALLGGCCADDDDAANEAAPTVTVPLTITVATEWQDDDVTRAAPPDAAGQGGTGGESVTVGGEGWDETETVDRVRVITFRRPYGVGIDYAGDQERDFVYDGLNDITLTNATTVSDKTDSNLPTTHRHRQFTGQITKTYGFEYRFIALAYRSTWQFPFTGMHDNVFGEDKIMMLNTAEGLTFSQFKATFYREGVPTERKQGGWYEYWCGDAQLNTEGALETDKLDDHIASAPQLFWGYLHNVGDTGPVVQYTDDNFNPATPITGLLQRGMAEIVVNFTWAGKHHFGADRDLNWITLLSDNYNNEVFLNSYDRFLDYMPTQRQSEYTAISIGYPHDNQLTIRAFMLPCRTRLALRALYGRNTAITHKNSIKNCQIHVPNATTAGTATGVISPDAADNVFYLRRNHKYVINITSSEYMFDKHYDL